MKTTNYQWQLRQEYLRQKENKQEILDLIKASLILFGLAITFYLTNPIN